MVKTRKPSAEDIELFRRSVGPVRKISCDRIGPAHRPPPPRRRFQSEPPPPEIPDKFSDAYDPGSVAADETLFFARPGLQQRPHGFTGLNGRVDVFHQTAQGRIGKGASGDGNGLKNRNLTIEQCAEHAAEPAGIR